MQARAKQWMTGKMLSTAQQKYRQTHDGDNNESKDSGDLINKKMDADAKGLRRSLQVNESKCLRITLNNFFFS